MGQLTKIYVLVDLHSLHPCCSKVNCRLVQKEEKSQTSLLVRQGEERSGPWPSWWLALLVALVMEPSFAWVSNVRSSRQNAPLLKLSIARGGHVKHFQPMRHEQNSPRGCGKLCLLCFPFISALKMYMMADARAAIIQPQGEGWRITIMSALMLSYWTITSKQLTMWEKYSSLCLSCCGWVFC